MHSNNKKSSNFPDPLAPSEVKQGREYGLKYAKSIYQQWGKIDQQNSVFGNRKKTFEKNRRYANGTQETAIDRWLMTCDGSKSGDGNRINWNVSPGHKRPKFERIGVKKSMCLNP